MPNFVLKLYIYQTQYGNVFQANSKEFVQRWSKCFLINAVFHFKEMSCKNNYLQGKTFFQTVQQKRKKSFINEITMKSLQNEQDVRSIFRQIWDILISKLYLQFLR